MSQLYYFFSRSALIMSARLVCMVMAVTFVLDAVCHVPAVQAAAAQKVRAKPSKKKEKSSEKTSVKTGAISRMDYGRAIAYTIRADWPKGNLAYKGLAVSVGNSRQAAVVYDTDLMRVAAVSEGGHLDISKINYTSYKGNDVASLQGEQLVGTSILPGWADPESGSFSDPRSYPNGPMPASWLKYHGHYVAGEHVVLSYRVGKHEVLERPGASEVTTKKQDKVHVTWREFVLGPTSQPLKVLIATSVEAVRPSGKYTSEQVMFLRSQQSNGKKQRGVAVMVPVAVTNTGVVRASKAGLALEVTKEKNLILRVVPSAKARRFCVAFSSLALPKSLGDLTVKSAISAIANATSILKKGEVNALSQLKKGGENRWKDAIELKGRRGADTRAYVIDEIPVPFKNPYGSWMRTVAFDFFSDGTRAAVSTWNGDVWLVSGIDKTLEHVKWKRFAAGLFEPLGLTIVDDQVYALGRDRITRLHDINDDGEADFYESFNSSSITHPRAITCELQRDSKGWLYFQKNGNRTPKSVPLHGCVLRVSADGKKQEVFAAGIRSANGLGVGKDALGREVIASSDQEGNWTPACRIDFLRGGDFVGYKPHSHTRDEPDDDAYKRPLCWIPKSIDNSTGGLAWCGDDRFGPMKGNWLAASYGQAKLFMVMHELNLTAKGTSLGQDQSLQEQGGVVQLPLNFGTGIQRLRFNKADGQLYVVGLKGWQTRGAKDGGFYRVRYTGKSANLPVRINAIKSGVRITFSEPLDKELAADLESYQVQRWNYKYTSKYGSSEYSVAESDRKGRDSAKVKGASLSKDGRVVTLELEDMKPVMQMMIKFDLESVNGSQVRREIYHTVHWLGE
jgi:hypothetical protein